MERNVNATHSVTMRVKNHAARCEEEETKVVVTEYVPDLAQDFFQMGRLKVQVRD